MGQRDEERAVVIAVDHLGRHLQGQPRLPNPAGSCEREQPDIVLEQRGHRGVQFLFAPDELGGLGREIVRVGIQRAERRERLRKLRMHDLKELLGPLQIFQAVLAQVFECEALRQRLFQHDPGRVGDEDLPAMRRRTDAGRAVHVQTHIGAPVRKWLAGMDADPGAQDLSRRPPLRKQGALDGHCCRRGVRDAGKHEKAGVANRVDPLAAVLHRATVEDLPVAGQHSRVLIPEPLHQASRAFDIGEEERDGSGRQLRHGRSARYCRQVRPVGRAFPRLRTAKQRFSPPGG